MSDALTALGWDEAWATAFAQREVSSAHPARVVAESRDRWIIGTDSGVRVARLVSRSSGPARPVTGDWVGCTPGPNESDPWTILSVLPRRSAVLRGAAGESQSRQVLAANVDLLWIVHALDRSPNLRSLERYLAVAWESGATPEIVLTKADLAEDLEGAVDQVHAIAFGTPVWVMSVYDPATLDALRMSLVAGRTVALLGPSGAGKSTLINALGESGMTRTGEVRSRDRKGRHTTTRRELFRIHGGALLLDTPGMRELKVLELGEGLDQAFPEIEELTEHCRFRDCSHASEPGCAVLAAVEEGRLSPDRVASYRKLQAEAAHERRKEDPRARARHVGEHKTALKTLQYHPKRKWED